MKVAIIEDELLTAEDLMQTLTQVNPKVKVVKHLKSVQESVLYLNQKPAIDLIFSDIQLGDGLSFEVFARTENKIPVVFCTAYDDYLLEAFKSNGIDYMLKPIGLDAVAHTLEKYFALQQQFSKVGFTQAHQESFYYELSQQTSPKSNHLIVYQQDRIIPLAIADIALCYIELENVFLKTFDGKEYTVARSLDDLEKTLGNLFFRVNRQHLLARKALKHASFTVSRKLHLTIAVPYKTKVYVSREKATVFLNWLES